MGFLQEVWSFLGAHSGPVGAVVVAVVDFLIALNPNLQSNSLIELLLSVFQSKSS